LAAFGEQAARKIDEHLPERDREILARALRARPSGAEALSLVDYLYLGQLVPLLFASGNWREGFASAMDTQHLKHRLQAAVEQIAPVRNEIAHVREVSTERLMKANVASTDVLEMLRGRSAR
jgi:hypothetical protein